MEEWEKSQPDRSRIDSSYLLASPNRHALEKSIRCHVFQDAIALVLKLLEFCTSISPEWLRICFFLKVGQTLVAVEKICPIKRDGTIDDFPVSNGVLSPDVETEDFGYQAMHLYVYKIHSVPVTASILIPPIIFDVYGRVHRQCSYPHQW